MLLSEFDCQQQRNNATSGSDASLLQLYTFFLFMFQTLFRLSDTALNVLITFFTMFLKTPSQKFAATPHSFLSKLPSNLRAARSVVGNSKCTFERFVCCPNCCSIYSLQDCIIKHPNGSLESKKCSFVPFPNHPQVQHRKPCEAVLMKNQRERLYSTPSLFMHIKALLNLC